MNILRRASTLPIALLGSLLVYASMVDTARGAGFDQHYSVRVGDENGDGTNDAIFVNAPGALVIPIDDIPIIVSPGVRDFILRSNGQSGFTIDGQLSAAVHQSGSAGR